MKNKKVKNEFLTDDDLIEKIKNIGDKIKPPENVLKSVLEKLSETAPKNIPSPYASPSFLFRYRTVFISAIVLVLLVVGGFAYNRNSNSNIAINLSPNLSDQNPTVSISNSGTSNAALDQDLAAVDAQLKLLDRDNSQI